MATIRDLLGDKYKDGMTLSDAEAALQGMNLVNLSTGEYVSKAKYQDAVNEATRYKAQADGEQARVDAAVASAKEKYKAELDEQFYIDGYNLDVDQLVGSELILNRPIRVLCREDCKGISDRYGTNPGSEEGGEEAALDPRMSVIQDIFKQMKEV